MKQIEIEYIPSLGSFLDEQGIEWANIGDNKILISYVLPKDLFLLGVEFHKWRVKYNL